MANPVKIMIVDDHPIVREGLRNLLELEDDFEVVAELGNGLHCLQLLEKISPDLILMDIRMPGIDGLETTRLICEKYPQTKVLVLTIHTDDQFVVRAIESGACGYLLKNVARSDIIRIIRNVLNGEAYIEPSLTSGIFKQFKQSSQKSGYGERIPLTRRELEVLNGLATGRTYHQIASDLFISEHTVRSHIKSLYKKLSVKSRALAVAKGIKIGLVRALE